eukprot:1227900-Alexandrium_andersonii.AAC.1
MPRSVAAVCNRRPSCEYRVRQHHRHGLHLLCMAGRDVDPRGIHLVARATGACPRRCVQLGHYSDERGRQACRRPLAQLASDPTCQESARGLA